MPFPAASRVRYARNPIEFVVCQLRFPPILRIDAEIPSRFQDLIRVRYPLYESKPQVSMPGLPPDVARIFSQNLAFSAAQKSHEFMDATRTWTLSLDREKLTLHCQKYESWEEFKDLLGTALDALRQVYSPPFYLRIGLRYRDVIRRSEHGLKDTVWKDLLTSSIVGPYCSPDVENDTERIAHQDLIRLSDGQGRVLITHDAGWTKASTFPSRRSTSPHPNKSRTSLASCRSRSAAIAPLEVDVALLADVDRPAAHVGLLEHCLDLGAQRPDVILFPTLGVPALALVAIVVEPRPILRLE